MHVRSVLTLCWIIIIRHRPTLPQLYSLCHVMWTPLPLPVLKTFFFLKQLHSLTGSWRGYMLTDLSLQISWWQQSAWIFLTEKAFSTICYMKKKELWPLMGKLQDLTLQRGQRFFLWFSNFLGCSPSNAKKSLHPLHPTIFYQSSYWRGKKLMIEYSKSKLNFSETKVSSSTLPTGLPAPPRWWPPPSFETHDII